MPPRRQRASTGKQSARSAELPEAVWTQIASKMSLNAWAKASGTCRTTFRLQLRTVAVPSELPQAGVAWVSKRLSCARALEVDAKDWQGLALAMKHGLNDVPTLEQLEITGSSPEAGNAAVAHHMSMFWLLASAPKLTLLSASLGKVPWFPPLSRIKHLVFTLEKDADTATIFAALSNAITLETLSMDAAKHENVLKASVLQLEALPCLHSVRLDAIRPAGTHLPEDCTLHLVGLVQADFASPKWNSALNKVSTFEFFDTKLKIIDPLPPFFGKLRFVTSVEIRVEELGHPETFLSLEGLAHVQKLYLSGDYLYLDVPDKVSWQEVYIDGSNELVLSFVDPACFAETVPAVTLRFCFFRGESLFELIQAWGAFDRSWGSKSYETKTVISCPSDSEVDFFEICCCGACMVCLRD